MYFDNFDNGRKPYSITIAKGNDTDPLKLVKSLKKEIIKNDLDLSNGDMAFCKFDTDEDSNKNKLINEANKYALQNGIRMIISSPCIELWFLLHYDYTTARLSNDEVIKRLKQYYPKYDKNINIYKEINENVDEAIKRAKKLENYQIENGKIIGTTDANPSTEMYKIVEYLNIMSK